MNQHLTLLLCLLLLFPPGWALAAPGPTLSSSTELARAGNYQLRWSHESPMVETYRLERASDPLFINSVLIYQGADRATVVSGRSNGLMHYRVRAQFSDGSQSDWSDPISVSVQHHSLRQALLLFALGALVFIATTALIFTGNRAHQRDLERPS